MKAKIFLSVLLTGLFFVSCKKEETVETAAKPVPSVYEVLNGSNATATPPPAPVQVQQNTTAPPQTVTTTQTAPAPVAVAKGMNPSHGQPGHRCDIPVGAPLNSPPGKAAKQPQAITPTPGKAAVTSTTIPANTTTTTNTMTKTNSGVPELLSTPAPVTTAPGMNPPHGQAGHRCDIAVGAPLPKT